MDRATALFRVQLNGMELANVGEDLQRDPEVVLKAVWQDSFALQFAAPGLRADRYFALRTVQQNGAALQCLSEQLRSDREVVLKAVTTTGFALRWASTELQADYSVVERAVRRDGFALRYASEALRSNKSIALAAAQQNHRALDYVAAPLQGYCRAELEAAAARLAHSGQQGPEVTVEQQTVQTGPATSEAREFPRIERAREAALRMEEGTPRTPAQHVGAAAAQRQPSTPPRPVPPDRLRMRTFDGKAASTSADNKAMQLRPVELFPGIASDGSPKHKRPRWSSLHPYWGTQPSRQGHDGRSGEAARDIAK